MRSAIFCKLLSFDGNSHFPILFLWCHFNYMSLPKQWMSEWLCLQEHLAHDGGRAERDFQFIMTHSGTKLDSSGQGLCYRQLVTNTNPWSIIEVFLANCLGGWEISLYSGGQQFNLGKGEDMGNSCCPLKEMTWFLHLVILLGNRVGNS